MRKAVFMLRNTLHRWSPPFGKEISSNEHEVEEGKHFESLPKEGPVFRLVKCDGNKALVEFSEKFTLKGHLHPRNRQVWVGMTQPVLFTYLWGEDGMTKSLLLKEIVEPEQA